MPIKVWTRIPGPGQPATGNAKFTWLGNGNFYTLRSIVDANDELLFTRVGANDPDFYLRRDAAFTIRRQNAGNTIFVNVIEPHGSYSPVSESAINSKSSIVELEIL